MKKYPKNILIIRLSSIGDIVLTSPLISTLRKYFPKSEIDFVIKKQFVDLIKYNPNLNNIYELDTSEGFTGLKELKNQIKAKNYGIILDIHKNFRSTYLRLFSKARIKKLYKKRRFIRTLLVIFKINRYKEIIPISQAYMNVLKDLDMDVENGKLEFYIPDDVQVRTNKFLLEKDFTEKHNIVTLCIGAGFFTKRWPEEYFAELIRLIKKDKKAKVIILGGEADIGRVEKIKDISKSEFLNLCGKSSLIESAAVLNCSNIVISNDTGLMHIAQALGKNLIVIFGSTTKELGYFPTSDNSIVLERELQCRPCTHNGRDKCPEEHFKCMMDIKPEEVFENICKFI